MLFVEKDKTTNILDYNKYLGQDGKHKNYIFPYSIPNSDNIDEFCYYYNPFDPNYVSYLVYSCNDEDYKKETERLSKIKSSKNYLIYSAAGFNYPVCAVYADDYSGCIYALEDKENNFCNYFSDINYEDIIDKKYLPIDFKAKSENPTKLNFSKSIKENL